MAPSTSCARSTRRSASGRRRPVQRHLVAVRIVDFGQQRQPRAGRHAAPTHPRSSPTADDCRRRRRPAPSGADRRVARYVRHPAGNCDAQQQRSRPRQRCDIDAPAPGAHDDQHDCQVNRPSPRRGRAVGPRADAAAHQRDQLCAVDGLDQMVVEPDGLRSLAVLRLPVPRDGHQQHVAAAGPRTQQLGDPISVHDRQAQDRAARCPAAALRHAPALRRRPAPCSTWRFSASGISTLLSAVRTGSADPSCERSRASCKRASACASTPFVHQPRYPARTGYLPQFPKVGPARHVECRVGVVRPRVGYLRCRR